MEGLSVITTMLAMVSTGTTVGRFAVVSAGVAMGGLSMIATMLAMVSTGTTVGRFAVVSAGFATGGLSVITTMLAVVSAGTTVRRPEGITTFEIRPTVWGGAGFAAVATTSIPLPGITHSFKTLAQLLAFLLAHVVPSLPHGGTP
jgi:hypothetical protein